MKKLLFITAIIIASSSFAQHKKDTGFVNVDLEKLKKQIDSSNKMMETLGNSMYKRMQAEDVKRMTDNSTRYFSQLQADRKQKEREAVYRNLILGFSFLVILVIGVFRRRKKPGEKI